MWHEQRFRIGHRNQVTCTTADSAVSMCRRVVSACPPKDHKAAVLYDSFTGNESEKDGLADRRDRVKTDNNFITLKFNGRSTPHMQPIDAINGRFRAGTDRYEDCVFGFDPDPLRRQRIEELLGDSLGGMLRDVDNLEHIVTAGLWGIRTVPVRLRRWAWVSRGIVPVEEWSTFSISRHVHVAICAFLCDESESEVKTYKILQPGPKNAVVLPFKGLYIQT